MSERLTSLAEAGVSIWLDDLSRERLTSGTLAGLVTSSSVVGVTTNPTIFASALAKGHGYDEAVGRLAAEGVESEEAVFRLTSDDVRDACDVFADVHAASDGVDGRVSIEVSPVVADDTEATVDQAVRLWETIDRPNLLIKIPATRAGLPAITEVIGRGISVNVTLIFAIARYREVMEAYVAGLEQAARNGHDLSRIHSVASFFVSRVDSEVDARLDALGADPSLKGRAALANARLAHREFTQFFAGDRWDTLVAQGARAQRPLWASTGVKNPAYPDTMYVTDLVVPGTVNTMPEPTLEAFADHGQVRGDQVTPHYDEAERTMQELSSAGIDLDDVIATLEKEGVEKFVTSWNELLETVRDNLDKAAQA
ncbi:transaldolase [Nocardioides sp. Y6]|uniref:Transaldolase n=1 Tax=Nocardioides malaquae TaxID=2773426 RepID=A0ABR9RT84_9ACTN|nr:transaldolase [Nocardioides malaquae]MBE7324377.1 transaldolase [Nocardioides malaquae]